MMVCTMEEKKIWGNVATPGAVWVGDSPPTRGQLREEVLRRSRAKYPYQTRCVPTDCACELLAEDELDG